MRNWHQDKRTDIGLRLMGIALWGLAGLAVRQLMALHVTHTHAAPDMRTLALAAAAFLCASLGAILLTQGRHIFDRIEVGERWRIDALPGLDPQDRHP